MTTNDYRFVIRRGDVARDLQTLRDDISADDCLTALEKIELLSAVDEQLIRLTLANAKRQLEPATV